MTVGRRALGDVRREPAGERADLLYLVGLRLVVAADPTLRLPLQEPVGPAEVPEAGLPRVDGVQLDERVRDRPGDPAAQPLVRLDALRKRFVEHDARPLLHHVEGRADDPFVVHEEVGLRGERVGRVQLREDAGLPPHVVRPRGDGAERRAAQHALPGPDLQQVGQVRRAVGELLDLEITLRQPVYPLAQDTLDDPRVEPLALADFYRLGHRVSSLVGGFEVLRFSCGLWHCSLDALCPKA